MIRCQHFPVGHAGLEHDEFTLTTAERLAKAGHAVAVPFLFHWWPKQADMALKRNESRDERMVADLEATFEYLCAQPNVDASRIGIVGHCWGAEWRGWERAKALTAGGVEHTFHRYAGAGHAFQNFPTPDRYRERASEDARAKLLTFLATQLHTDSTGV